MTAGFRPLGLECAKRTGVKTPLYATRFAAAKCHVMQHKVVLQVMREGAVQAAAGDLASVRVMASELALWFAAHAQSMDAALVLQLRRVGYDPSTGEVYCPDACPIPA